jgi:hypothetical protein
VELDDKYDEDRSADSAAADATGHSGAQNAVYTISLEETKNMKYYDMDEMWGSVYYTLKFDALSTCALLLFAFGVIVWASTLYAHYRHVKKQLQAAHKRVSVTVQDFKSKGASAASS